MSFLLYLALTVTAGGLIGAEIYLSKLIDFQFLNARDNWVADGKPAGGKNSRKAKSFWLSGFSRIGVGYDWLFASPGWAAESAEAKSLLKSYRLCSGIFAAGLASLLTIAFVG
ncbi:MAG: hypothetical protein ACE5JX_20815 [Acidobacteriota bacterium]